MAEQHDFPYNANPQRRCKACGTTWHYHNVIVNTPCPGRSTQQSEKLRPEPARRIMACESWDAINARIAQLDAERQTNLSKPEAPIEGEFI